MYWLLVSMPGCNRADGDALLATVEASPATHPEATATRVETATLVPTLTVTFPPTQTPRPTLPPTRTVTATQTPTYTPLGMFATSMLRPGVLTQAYLADACQFLQLRWDPANSPPGTVVVPVMFHSIVQSGTQVSDPKDISIEQFQAFVQYAVYLGFETITTVELRDFLLYNAPIPPRSMILIVDDRRPGLIYEHFIPVLEANGWTVTAAYIADPDSFGWAWDWMERLNETGLLDIQSHGYTGQLYILPETPLEQIQAEIWDSTAILEEHFGQRPIAFIWPGGNFTQLSTQVARQGGYELGFTAFSRGPLMFNWVPLGEEEQIVNDPLMVLPRAWSNSVNVNLDEAVSMADEAIAFAETYRPVELAWYAAYCAGR